MNRLLAVAVGAWVVGVLAGMVENRQWKEATEAMQREITSCGNCHYHRHLFLGLAPYYGAEQRSWCKACKHAVDNTAAGDEVGWPEQYSAEWYKGVEMGQREHECTNACGIGLGHYEKQG